MQSIPYFAKSLITKLNDKPFFFANREILLKSVSSIEMLRFLNFLPMSAPSNCPEPASTVLPSYPEVKNNYYRRQPVQQQSLMALGCQRGGRKARMNMVARELMRPRIAAPTVAIT